MTLTQEQSIALEFLRSGENIFLTGGAGSGKSHLIRSYLEEIDIKQTPILASTGAAAVLLGGRTFHSFFGLGIMDGGPDATFERGCKDGRLMARLRKVEGVIIDEISMIPGRALQVAESLAKKARESSLPWGGLRIVAVGDFAQLPPVDRIDGRHDWAFMNHVWEETGFQSCVLSHNQRVHETDFLDVLDDIRQANVTDRVQEFLQDHVRNHDHDDLSPRLFPRRNQSESYNLSRLAEIPEPEEEFPTIYFGNDKHIAILMKSAPVPVMLKLKKGCQVLFIQNDPQKRWINGTRGIIVETSPDKITVKKHGGRDVTVEKSSFAMQDADGNVVASAVQFPLTLAYATTIHKSQGATLDELWCDLGSLWEPGQAYVALSRLRTSQGLKLIRWSHRSFIADPKVVHFYRTLNPVNIES